MSHPTQRPDGLSTDTPATGPEQLVDVTLQLRLPARHPVVVGDHLFATVNIDGDAFTLERCTPMRPVGERLYLADYSHEFSEADLVPIDAEDRQAD